MPEKITDMISRRLHELWADATAAAVPIEHDLSNLREHAQASLQHWLANPEVVRSLLNGLRDVKPVLAIHGFAVVTKHADVLEVLSHDEDFTVQEIYAAKMERTSGSFFLGMDRGPQYEREHGLLRMATHPSRDVPRIRDIVRTQAESLIEAAKPSGRIDAVNGLARVIATRVVEEYFGVPGPSGAISDAATSAGSTSGEQNMMAWHRAIFRDIFINLTNDPQITAKADSAAKEMNAYTSDLYTRRKAELAAGPNGRDDFLTRLLKMQSDPATALDDAGIRRNVNGTILGAIETTSKAASQALDQLLRRPAELRGACEAAAADDDRLLSAYVFEALRFNPHNPIILRHCERPYTVAAGTSRETVIAPGSLVFAATLAAMFDPDKFPSPGAFLVTRPMENYIHFGHGLHTCFGEYINVIQVPEVLKALLRLKGLRRAAGPEGVLSFDGPFPDRLVVEFDA